MEKVEKIKAGTDKARQQEFLLDVRDLLMVPWNLCKAAWRWVVDLWRKIWAWVRGLDVPGMVNLLLLIVIIVLFISLVMNLVHGRKHKITKDYDNNNEITTVQTDAQTESEVAVSEPEKTDNVSITEEKFNYTENGVNKRNYDMVLPMKVDKSTGITPQIQVVGVEKPIVIKEVSTPSDELPEQKLYGDVIVDKYAGSPVLSNGVSVDGNLFIQNMRKYTLPCDAIITGNLFIRNVEKLRFCGKFTVKGNIYVNRQSAFGPIPRGARIGGQIIL